VVSPVVKLAEFLVAGCPLAAEAEELSKNNLNVLPQLFGAMV
jgi:hypothetical protein